MKILGKSGKTIKYLKKLDENLMKVSAKFDENLQIFDAKFHKKFKTHLKKLKIFLPNKKGYS